MVTKRKPSQQPSSDPDQDPLVDIPEVEQWRIIKESGILKTIPVEPEVEVSSPETGQEAEGLSPLAEEIFGAITLIIPHSFLLLMMEMLIHYQYGRQPTLKALADRMIPAVPILSVLIFYTSRYKHTRSMQAGLFLAALITGGRLIYNINIASWKLNMRQSPPLATIWVYAVVQLDLIPAVLSLVLLAGWVRYQKLSLFF